MLEKAFGPEREATQQSRTWPDIQRPVWKKPLSTQNLWLKCVPGIRDRGYKALWEEFGLESFSIASG